MLYSHLFPAPHAPEFYTAERCYITELFNSPRCPAASIAQARVETGVTTARHALAETDEWYYILRGQGQMYVDGQIAGPVASGDVVFIPAGMPQCIENTGMEELVFLCICVPGFREGVYRDLETKPAAV